MSDSFHNELVRRAAARVLQQQQLRRGIPIPTASESTLDILSQVTQLYLSEMSFEAKKLAEISGRSEPNAFDVISALENNSVNINDLYTFGIHNIRLNKIASMSVTKETIQGIFLAMKN
ncbi:hypothetical protein K502DRAFT_174663 [Neoconidiobolus thromboides FSU 785]|nr:hypothetical protein K502DRAFT_174663 [Neoconidiobolus thromboides FSU 785]